MIFFVAIKPDLLSSVTVFWMNDNSWKQRNKCSLSRKISRFISTKPSKSINSIVLWFVLLWFPWTQSLLQWEVTQRPKSLTYTKNRSEAFKYSSNPHFRFRLCSIVKHTLFSRWFYTARPWIGFTLDASLCYSSSWYFVRLSFSTYQDLAIKHALNICLLNSMCNFITLWSFPYQNHFKFWVIYTK